MKTVIFAAAVFFAAVPAIASADELASCQQSVRKQLRSAPSVTAADKLVLSYELGYGGGEDERHLALIICREASEDIRHFRLLQEIRKAGERLRKTLEGF